jgi:Transglycosylase SLT domain/D-alanyl-D-alanine carboxypeptidase
VAEPQPLTVLVATELGQATGGLALAASVGVAAARLDGDAEPQPVLIAELGAGGARGPTMLASRAARDVERSLRAAGFEKAAARGALCWLGLPAGDGGTAKLAEALGALGDGLALAVVHAPAEDARALLESPELGRRAAVVRCELPEDRALAALMVGELRRRRQRVRIERRPLGLLGARRALAGIEPGGSGSRRASRIASSLLGTAGRPTAGERLRSDGGQALPLVLGLAFVLVLAATVLIALGGGVAGAERGQSGVDLAAISAVRSMRDDLPRLAAPASLPNGAPNPYHLSRTAYLARAAAAARQAAGQNGLDRARLRVSFPDADSPVPLRARVEMTAEANPGRVVGEGSPGAVEVTLHAEAEATPPAASSAGSAEPAMATGGGYSGPLVYRQGKPMRPDVAAAFDRMAAAARGAGIALTVNSAYRSDAEQARLYAANPDPRWVAPPGTSLHRCATELDLGPPAAYPWLAANAGSFGFLQRYSWEPWHYGFTAGPAPCSAAGNAGGEPDGSVAAEGGLPAFVPAEYREPLLQAARRWGVSAGLLAAQLEAESGFNPHAASSAGALGIAQFMPSTAAAYGLHDPFDPVAAIDAEAHLMADLLKRFGSATLALAAYNAGPGAVAACSCVPDIPETQAYVARILGLMDASGALALPAPLEVRLVG